MSGILNISFPRSGCHYLKDSMAATLGPRFHRWVDSHKAVADYGYHNHVKSHDFDLMIEPPAGWQVVVQIRNPWDAIASWFDYSVDNGGMIAEKAVFNHWVVGSAGYWNGFAVRWLDRARGCPVIHHASLVAEPAGYVSAMCLRLGFPVEPKPLPLRPTSTFATHKFYSNEARDMIWRICRIGLARAGYDWNGP